MVGQTKAVRVISPATALRGDFFAQALGDLRADGLPIIVTAAENQVEGRFAGSDPHRAAALAGALGDDCYSALLCVQGGYGSGRIVRHLPFDALRRLKQMQPLIGYSDISYLASVLHLECDAPFVHGPMLIDFLDPAKEASCRQLMDFLRTGDCGANFDLYRGCEPVRAGQASGKLVGGNLSMMCALLGTPWERVFDGAILILEETFEFLYRLDRMMLHLREAGVFDRVAGLIFGSFDRMQDSATPFGMDAREIVLANVRDFRGPIAWGAPFGHGAANAPVPMFKQMTLFIDQKVHLSRC